MNLIAWPSFTLFPLHVLLASHLLRLSRRSMANRLFALLNLQLGLWSLAHGCYVLAPQYSSAWFYYRIATVAWLGIPSVFLHLLVELTDAWSKPSQRRLVLLSLYSPVVLFFARVLETGKLLDSGISLGALGWYEQSDFANPWAIGFVVLWCVGGIVGLGLVHRWQQYQKGRLEKLQGRIIVGSGLLSLVVNFAYTVVLPTALPDTKLSTMSPLAMTVWTFGMWYAVSRYGWLRISPTIAAEDILQKMTEPLVITDVEQRIVRVNPAFESLCGIPAEQLLRRPLNYVLTGGTLAPAEYKRRLDTGELRDCEVAFQRRDGTQSTLMVSGASVENSDHRSSGFVVVMRDVTKLKQAEEQLRHLATHDPLTGLPNRVLFKDRADQEFARARRNRTSGVVLMLDLDGFKQINDSLGHEAGDEVLREVAARCQHTLRETDTFARLGGDEFVALLTGLKRSEDAHIGIHRLERELAKPFLLGASSITVGVSIGMAVFPEEGTDLDSLMRVADSAMYTTKAGAKIFESATIRQAPSATLDARSLATALPRALDRKEFELWYQPLHHANDGRVLGVEALLRWRHPDFGTIGPLQFLPLAERTGLVIPIGAWALRMACIQNKSWQVEGKSPIPVAVNVSAKQLVRADFADIVEKVLAECELEPRYLHIEISEAAAMHDLSAIKNTLQALSTLGVRIVVDDFGSGFSALTQLEALSVYAVKISHHLIYNMVNQPRDATIVRSIVSMANAFGIQAIAKGVETTDQLEFLRALRWEPSSNPACDQIQGFVFSHPVPALELTPLLGTAASVG